MSAEKGPIDHLKGDFDVERIRADFPILSSKVNNRPLVYLDNGATSQKPIQVISAIEEYYRTSNSNVHRGIHSLSQRATDQYEAARRSVQKFINAASDKEIIFTKGTTDAINLLTTSLSRGVIKEGDEILITEMEHHSNIVPWQMLCEATGASLKAIPVDDRGDLILDDLENLLNSKTKYIALVHVSNTLGTINPIERLTKAARKVGAKIFIDAAQSVPHMKVDVQDLDCDFLCFSAHKMCGPTGMGALYGKADLLEALPPYQGGGSMITNVTIEKTDYNVIPFRFEAGTPNIAGSVGFGAAAEYLMDIGMDRIANYEIELSRYASECLKNIDGLKMIGDSADHASVFSFLLEGIHPLDTGTILDQLGIAVRTGHHCTQPLMDKYGIPGTVRASLAFYNTTQEVDLLVEGLERVKSMMS